MEYFSGNNDFDEKNEDDLGNGEMHENSESTNPYGESEIENVRDTHSEPELYGVRDTQGESERTEYREPNREQDFNRNFSEEERNMETRPKKRMSDAGCVVSLIVIVLVTVFSISILVGLLIPKRDSGSNQGGSPTVPFISESPRQEILITPVPVPEGGDRPMTEYDGSLPAIKDTANPFPDIIEGVQGGVVSVCNYGVSQLGLFGNRESLQGSGTGFVISSDGYVVTNAHVIEGASRVSIILSGSQEVEVDVIGYDTSTDIAVLKFNNNKYNVEPLYLGDSSTVRVGEFVITVGDPSGIELAGTITFGIISAVDRSVNIDGRTNVYLQTDAAMNPGNSGGPLINIKGEVIGLNSAKTVTASYDENGNAISAEGLGFAIPINTVKSITEALITKGKIERPGIGVTIAPATDVELQEAGLTYGLRVHDVVENGPCDDAGIHIGDVIYMCGGVELHETSDLTAVIQAHSIGDRLQVKLSRDGVIVDAEITIGDLNNMG